MSVAARSSKAKGSAFTAFHRLCLLTARRILSPLQLVRALTLVALLSAAVSMTGSHAAMAMPAPAAAERGMDHAQEKAAGMSSHCAEMQSDAGKGEHKKGGIPDIACMIACSGIPVTLGAYAPEPILERMRHFVPLANPLHGLPGKADTPPPRSSDA